MLLSGPGLEVFILFMLAFLSRSFLVPRFSDYTLTVFLMMLSVILLFVSIILHSTVSVIRPLIFVNSSNWLLILNLTYETRCTGTGSCSLLFNAGETKLVLFDLSNNYRAIQIDGFVFDEKSSFKILGLPFFSKLDGGT